MPHKHEGEKDGTEMHGDPCLNRKRMSRNACERDPLTPSDVDSEPPGASHLAQDLHRGLAREREIPTGGLSARWLFPRDDGRSYPRPPC
jgi:hypothetical protein